MIISVIMLICSSICTWNPVCLTLWKTLLGFWSAWELKSWRKVISSRDTINISVDRLYISVYLSLEISLHLPLTRIHTIAVKAHLNILDLISTICFWPHKVTIISQRLGCGKYLWRGVIIQLSETSTSRLGSDS